MLLGKLLPFAAAVLAGLIISEGSVHAEVAASLVERKEALPKRLEGVDVVEHLNQSLPLDLKFIGENGKPVQLRDYFDGHLPVVLTLNYSNCPMLCSLQLQGVVAGFKGLEWTIGQQFQVVTVSLDPNETPAQASKSKSRYLTQYGRPESLNGWHFLTGSEQNIRALADAIGFKYAYNEKRAEYVHPAAITLATPSGKIGRYLYGLNYDPKTLRLGLVEASEGRVGSTLDRLILYCFHYDADEGRYAPVARNIMQLGGGVTVLVLAGFITVLSKRGKRAGKQQ